MKLLISLVVWAGAVFGAVELSSAVASHNKTPPSSGALSQSGSAGAPFDPSSVKATDRLSLFKQANLARALAVGRRHLSPNERISDVTLYPGYLAFQVVRSDSGGQAEIQANGAYSFISFGATPSQGLFSLTAIRAGTPAKLARRLAASAHVAESGLAYMILQSDPISGGLHWLVYPIHKSAAEYYQSSATGGHLVAWTANGPRPLR